MRISLSKLAIAMVHAGVDTSQALAERAGISCNTISRIRNGGSAKVPTIRKIAAALGVDPAEIIDK